MRKVTIKGLTNCTITLNKMNMVLRGNCKDLKTYPNSILANVDVQNAEQERELFVLQEAKIIQVIDEGNTSDVKELSSKNKSSSVKKINRVSDSLKDISDTITKGNDNTTLIDSELSKLVENSDTKTDSSSETVVIEDDNGSLNIVEVGNEDESIKAAEKMDQEERDGYPMPRVEEEKKDISERMGNEVVIGAGNSAFSKVAIKTSVFDADVKTGVKRDPFIDREDKKTLNKQSSKQSKKMNKNKYNKKIDQVDAIIDNEDSEYSDSKANEAFIDKKNDDGTSIEFIEV